MASLRSRGRQRRTFTGQCGSLTTGGVGVGVSTWCGHCRFPGSEGHSRALASESTQKQSSMSQRPESEKQNLNMEIEEVQEEVAMTSEWEDF